MQLKYLSLYQFRIWHQLCENVNALPITHLYHNQLVSVAIHLVSDQLYSSLDLPAALQNSGVCWEITFGPENALIQLKHPIHVKRSWRCVREELSAGVCGQLASAWPERSSAKCSSMKHADSSALQLIPAVAAGFFSLAMAAAYRSVVTDAFWQLRNLLLLTASPASLVLFGSLYLKNG